MQKIATVFPSIPHDQKQVRSLSKGTRLRPRRMKINPLKVTSQTQTEIWAKWFWYKRKRPCHFLIADLFFDILHVLDSAYR